MNCCGCAWVCVNKHYFVALYMYLCIWSSLSNDLSFIWQTHWVGRCAKYLYMHAGASVLCACVLETLVFTLGSSLEVNIGWFLRDTPTGERQTSLVDPVKQELFIATKTNTNGTKHEERSTTSNKISFVTCTEQINRWDNNLHSEILRLTVFTSK